MRYGIAVWNHVEPGVPVTELIQSLADFGFDSMSLQQHQRLQATAAAVTGPVARADRDVATTVLTRRSDNV